MSHPGGVNDSQLLSTMETRNKPWPCVPSWHGEGINFLLKGHICFRNISFCILFNVIFLYYSGSFDILFYDGFKKTVQGINIKMMPKEAQQQVSNLHNSVSHDE